MDGEAGGQLRCCEPVALALENGVLARIAENLAPTFGGALVTACSVKATVRFGVWRGVFACAWAPSEGTSLMSTNRPSRRRQMLAVFAASGIALAGSVALLAPSASTASSHREAPLIANDPQAENTDVYAFVSPDRPDTVTLIANWIPFEDPAGGPNFYPFSTDASYNIKIDTNGDAKPDTTYTWKFTTHDNRGKAQHGDKAGGSFLYNDGAVNYLSDKTLLFKQTYSLYKNGKKVGAGKVAPSNVGAASMPNYASLRAQPVTNIGGDVSYAGQADDPFFLDLRVFDLLYGTDLSEAGNDTNSGYNVNSVALQVPISSLTKGGDPVIGVWSTTDRPGHPPEQGRRHRGLQRQERPGLAAR